MMVGRPRLVGVSLVLPFLPPELRHWSLWHSGPLPELYLRGTRSVSICSDQGSVPEIGRGASDKAKAKISSVKSGAKHWSAQTALYIPHWRDVVA